MANAHVAYRAARDQLLDLSVNYSSALKTLEWPQLGESFNWAIAWFDQFAPVRTGRALGRERGRHRERYSFDDLAR